MAHTFELNRKGNGRRIIELSELGFLGRVQHVDHVEVLLVPLIQSDRGDQRLLLVGQLAHGETVVIETKLSLFRELAREIGDEH
jgi:hypothetical protein